MQVFSRPLLFHFNRQAHRPRSGFTLIELLVVIAIITILAAIILPVFAAAREHARRNACTTNLGKIGQALQLYKQDQGGYPPGLWDRHATWDSGTSSYIDAYNTDPTGAWSSGLLLLLGKVSPRVSTSSGPDSTLLAGLPAYLSSIGDLHCPDAVVIDPTDISYAYTSGPDATSGTWTVHQGYDNYDGPDLYAAAQAPWNYKGTGPNNPVSTMKYTPCRIPDNVKDNNAPCVSPYDDDFANSTYPMDFGNPDYTRQLKFDHPDDDTVVTWCTEHRQHVAGIPTPNGGKDDLVLFLDGKVMPKAFVPFSNAGQADHPITGNGLRTETSP